jgi:hypothetical protein
LLCFVQLSVSLEFSFAPFSGVKADLLFDDIFDKLDESR